MLIALALPGPARAAAPACGLVSDGEAAAALEAPARVLDGGAEKKGYSDCAWTVPGGKVISLILWSAARFDGVPGGAEEKYEAQAADLRRRGDTRCVRPPRP